LFGLDCTTSAYRRFYLISFALNSKTHVYKLLLHLRKNSDAYGTYRPMCYKMIQIRMCTVEYGS